MNWREYKATTLEQMKRRRWRTTRSMRNGHQEIPAGTEVRITGKSGGLTLTTDPCAHCGVSVYIRKVEPHAVEDIEFVDGLSG